MALSNYNKAIKLIEDNKDFAHFIGSRNKVLISHAEDTLGLVFPPSYYAFISRYGAGSFCGEEFYGITTDNFVDSSVPNAIWLTLNARIRYGLPKGFILIMGQDDGSYYAISAHSKNRNTEGEVALWFPRDDDVIITDDSFGHFLLRKVNEALD